MSEPTPAVSSEPVEPKKQHPMMWLFGRRVWRTSYQPTEQRKKELELARQEENIRRIEAAEEKRQRRAAKKAK